MHYRTLALSSLGALAASKPLDVFSKSDANANVWAPLSNVPSSIAATGDVQRRADTTWNPPSNLVTPLKQVWDHEMSTYSNPLGFKNYGFDQIMANKG